MSTPAPDTKPVSTETDTKFKKLPIPARPINILIAPDSKAIRKIFSKIFPSEDTEKIALNISIEVALVGPVCRCLDEPNIAEVIVGIKTEKSP